MLTAKVTGFIVADVEASVASGYAELASGDAVLALISEEFVAAARLLGDVAFTPNRADAPTPGAHVALWSDDIHGDWHRAHTAGSVVAAPYLTSPGARPPDTCVIQTG